MSLDDANLGTVAFIMLCLVHHEQAWYRYTDDECFYLYLETPRGQVRMKCHNDYEDLITGKINYLDENRWDGHDEKADVVRMTKWAALYDDLGEKCTG